MRRVGLQAYLPHRVHLEAPELQVALSEDYIQLPELLKVQAAYAGTALQAHSSRGLKITSYQN